MTIKIHPIQTGTVQIKVNQTRRAENNWPQLANLFLDVNGRIGCRFTPG